MQKEAFQNTINESKQNFKICSCNQEDKEKEKKITGNKIKMTDLTYQ